MIRRHGILGPPGPLVHRRDRFGKNAELVARALMIASAIYVVVLLAGWLLVPPLQREAVRVVEIPDRKVTILEEPAVELAPPPLTPQSMEQVAVREVADPPMAEGLVEEPQALPEPLRERQPKVDPDAGREGRRRAEAATAQLATATSALDRSLGDLSSALGRSTEGTAQPSRRRRARALAGGRSDAELAGIEAGRPAAGAADLEGSGVTGSVVAIGTLTPAAPEPSEGGGARPATSASRTNASLLAVIQRYAAGIQFCYENELHQSPGLRGKLVVAITISASGAVTDASVVQSTFASSRIATCALTQIRQWKFPPVAGGATSFQTPFVFTPPN